MVKKTGEEIVAPTDDIVPEVVEAPTAEQQLETLQTQVKAETEAREKAEKSAQGLRGSLTEKDTKLREQADFQTQLDGFSETQKIIAGMLNERLASGEGLEPTERKDYLAQFDEIAKRQEAEREQAQARSRQEEYGTQARATYAKAKEVFPDDDVKLLRIERFLDQGMLDDAEALIAKTEGKTTDTKENKVESEEEKFQKRLDEEKRKWMEESGMLESETGGPSGSVGSKEDARAKFIAGEITVEEARKRGVTFT